MIIEVDEDFLEHYGVLGMHWGVLNSGPGGTNKAPMSGKKKAAIAVGLGSLYVASVIATGGITLGVLFKGPLQALETKTSGPKLTPHHFPTDAERRAFNKSVLGRNAPAFHAAQGARAVQNMPKAAKVSDLSRYTFTAPAHGLPSRPGGHIPNPSDFTRVSHQTEELSLI